jgi:3-dehydroquinate synthase
VPQTALKVDLEGNAYDILIGPGLLAEGGARLAPVLPSKKICVVTDETVAKTYLLPFMKSLEASGFSACPPVILPPGEGTKSFEKLQYITDKLLSYRLDRKSALVALGGGVVGDITGFAASIVLRGMNFVQVPTTLLAQVDSSVGGKTGINTAQGKNLVGSFHQPKIVLIDTGTLKTLPPREMKAGYAEILKYALIDRPDFFGWLDASAAALLAGDAAALSHAIRESCAAKAAIVAADEREEKDLRALLNLGHTFGHALEGIGGYDGRLLHGEAVGIGMKMAFDFSALLGLCPPADAARISAHLEKIGLMAKPPFPVAAKDMLDRMRGDKKNANGKLTLILAKGIGKSFIAKDVDENRLMDYLKGVPWNST